MIVLRNFSFCDQRFKVPSSVLLSEVRFVSRSGACFATENSGWDCSTLEVATLVWFPTVCKYCPTDASLRNLQVGKVRDVRSFFRCRVILHFVATCSAQKKTSAN